MPSILHTKQGGTGSNSVPLLNQVPIADANGNYQPGDISSLVPSPLLFKGSISVSSDFPTTSDVKTGWYYHINADVTDNDVTKTNTDQSFLLGDEIVWNGTNWDVLGSTSLWYRTGNVLAPSNSGDSVNLGTGSIIANGQNLPINIGVVLLPTLTKNIDGTVTIGNDGIINFCKVSNGVGEIVKLNCSTGNTLTLTDNVPNFIYADYNNGSPIYKVTTDNTIFITNATLCPVVRATREGTTIHFEEYDEYGTLLANKLMFKDIYLNGAGRLSGLVLSTSATRISTVSSGSCIFSVQYFNNMDANIAGSSGLLYEYYLNAGNWVKSLVTSYDASYYSDGTNRQTLNNNYWVSKYFWRDVGNDNEVYYIHGNQYNNQSSAVNEIIPVSPSVMTSHSIYVGKIVIQKNATNGIAYPRQWEGAIQTAGVVNHNDLSGIQGGTTNEYYHLTSSEYTGTGTGIFVRKTSPELENTLNIKNTAGTDVELVLDRNANANWKILSNSGDLKFQSDYTTAKVVYYDVLKLFYNTGNATLKGKLSSAGLNDSTLTASQLVGTDASKNLISLSTATYPSLTELSYIKGVTSSIQTQLNSKVPKTGASYIQSTGISNAWGITNGTTTGAFNAIMGISDSATWLISGTSGGVFRGGIQLLDGGGMMRLYTSPTAYVNITGTTISGNLTGNVTGNTTGNTNVTNYVGKEFTSLQGGFSASTVGGGDYSCSLSTQTGYLKITLPVSWTNTMMRFAIDIFEYTTGATRTIYVGGYNYVPSSMWVNCSAYQSNEDTNSYSVRFGHDGTKCAIYIGEVNTAWDYIQVRVRDFLGGSGGATAANFATGWNIGVTTTLGTITVTKTAETVYHPSDADTSATASKLVLRDSAADIHCRLVRSNYVNESTISGGLVFRVNNSTDNYLRVCNSTSAIMTYLGALPKAGGTLTGNITKADGSLIEKFNGRLTSLEFDTKTASQFGTKRLDLVTSSYTDTYDPGDGFLETYFWDTVEKYDTQMYYPASTGSLKFRCRSNNASFPDWVTILDSSNYSNYIGPISGDSTACYIQGIYGKTSASGIAVLINSSHKLGTTTSSIRYKENVVDMADYSSSILNLRPVMFDYKDKYDDEGNLLEVDKHQPGLIAEEVAEVMPELVVYDTVKERYEIDDIDQQGNTSTRIIEVDKMDENGNYVMQPETVRYLNLIPLMLNEIKKLREEVEYLKNK